MKHIALLLGLIIAAPAVAQNDANHERDDTPVTQGANDQQKKAKKRQDPARQGQNGRGADRPGNTDDGPSPGLLRRFDTNGDGRLSNEEKRAARRRIAQWRDRDRGNDNPRGGNRGDRDGRQDPGDRPGVGSRGRRSNGQRPHPGVGGNGDGPKPQPGRGSRSGRGNDHRPHPGAGSNGGHRRPRPGARGHRGSRGNGPWRRPGRGFRDNRGNKPHNN